MPRIDGQFKFGKLKVNICFRQFLKEFLYEVQKYFEVVLWTSSQADYSQGLIEEVETKLEFKFDQCLTLAD